MAIDVGKVAQDILHQDAELRIMALQTLLRLDAAVLASRPELIVQMRNDLMTLASMDDGGDSRFFARQCLEHLERVFDAEVPPPPPSVTLAELDVGVLEGDDAAAHLAILARIAETGYSDARPAVLALLARAPRTDVVASILSALVRIGQAEDLPVVLPFLRSRDGRVRANAVEVVERLAPDKIVPLLSPFCADPVDRVRANALKALGSMGEDTVFNSLASMLQANSIASRVAALYALKHIRSDRGLDLLARAARDPSEEVRIRVVEATKSHRGHPRAAELLKVLSNDIDISICEAAYQALTVLCVGDDKGASEGAGLVESLSEQDQQVQLRSLREIESRRVLESRPAILALMERSSDPVVLAQAVATLSSFQVPADAEVLARYLAHSNDRLRANAVEAVARVAPPDAARRALAASLADPDSRVRANAICCLARLGAAGMETRVQEMLVSGDSSMSVSALWAASQIGMTIPLDSLHGLVRDLDPDVRQKVVELLDKYPVTRELADLVRELMRDPVVAIHEAAAKLWERIRPQLPPEAVTGPIPEWSPGPRRDTQKTSQWSMPEQPSDSGSQPRLSSRQTGAMQTPRPNVGGTHVRLQRPRPDGSTVGIPRPDRNAGALGSQARMQRPTPPGGNPASSGNGPVAGNGPPASGPYSRKNLYAALEAGRKGQDTAPSDPGSRSGEGKRTSHFPRGSLARTAEMVVSDLDTRTTGATDGPVAPKSGQGELEALYTRLDQELEEMGRKVYQLQTDQAVSEPAFERINYQIKRFDDLLRKRLEAQNKNFLSKLPFFRSTRKDPATQQLEFNLAEEYRKLGEAVIELRHSLDRTFPGVEQHYSTVEALLEQVKKLKEKRS